MEWQEFQRLEGKISLEKDQGRELEVEKVQRVPGLVVAVSQAKRKFQTFLNGPTICADEVSHKQKYPLKK